MTIQRERAGPRLEVLVTPRFLEVPACSATRCDRALASACRHSQIGYVHVWSYAGEQYQELLPELLFGGPLSKVDALVLDLRDGWAAHRRPT